MEVIIIWLECNFILIVVSFLRKDIFIVPKIYKILTRGALKIYVKFVMNKKK